MDTAGNIEPTVSQGTQKVAPGGTILIHPASLSSTSQYPGYVCAWQDGCKCSAVIADLFGEPHMEISAAAYTVKSDATDGAVYTIYATALEIGGNGPGKNVTNGEIRIGS
ncbi:MAG TPA: hypothetical protein VK601_19125 [Kofleriaceae bacterium]|nr:hypothetical protein [Kofleriaceae bacterium]